MKKFILAALAASVLTTPVLAQDRRHDDRGRVEQNHRADNGRSDSRGFDNRRVVQKTVIVSNNDRRQARSWQRGQRFESRYASNYRVIGNPRQYRLRDAPRGYRYVQSGNDAVLVGITSGIIAGVFANMIR